MSPADRVLAALATNGLLLKQDKIVPSVVGILTGESLRTSWWSHPRAHLIYAVLLELADHPDVLVAKLLDRKDTLIHRPLWPAALAVGTSGGPHGVGSSRNGCRVLAGLVGACWLRSRRTGGRGAAGPRGRGHPSRRSSQGASLDRSGRRDSKTLSRQRSGDST